MFAVKGLMRKEYADALFQWISQGDFWRRQIASFYDQDGIKLDPKFVAAEKIGHILSQDFLKALLALATTKFGCPFMPIVDITAHRLKEGQGIGIHTDGAYPGQETHRIVLTLHGEKPSCEGGLLLFFNSRNDRDISQGFLPEHNLAVGFPLTDTSFHAVSDINNGVRYSIVFSLWEDGEWPDAKARETFDDMSACAIRVLD